MNKYFLFTILLSSIILFNSCKQSEESDPNKPTIAVVLQTLNNPFFVEIQRGAEDAGKKLGVNVIVQAPERDADVEKQMQMVENFIQRNVSAICIAPSGAKEIIPAIIKANDANIPVVIIDARVDEKVLSESGGHILTYIGSDNIEGGRIAGEYVAKQLNYKGNVAILEGTSGVETGDKRLKGFLEAVKKYEGLKVVSIQNANFRRDEGFNVFQNMVQANPEIQAVFACNDMMALGAVEAVTNMKRDDIIVVGFDAIDDSRTAIRNNKMAGSIAQYPYEMGRLSIEYALKHLNGEKIDKVIPVKIELITKENLDKKL
jgi:ribose transport system substrate-binding protein